MTIALSIAVKYSCVLCGLRRVEVSVPARGKDDDLIEWMDRTIRLLGDDHRRRSTDCTPKTLQDLMIPVDGVEWVGGPAVQ